jgi:SpoVK/Ycf46/Vps4 family AAA+-type ATPase
MNKHREIVRCGGNAVVDCLQAGKLALLHQDTGTARLSLLEAARNLYSQAGLDSGHQRERQLSFARQLCGQAARLQAPSRQYYALEASGEDDREVHPPINLTARLADVVGCEAVKRTFQARFIYPLRQPQLAARYRLDGGGGVLLYGPPGTGKTMLARALAGELGVPVHIIRPAEILAKWLGDAEKKLAEVFAEARSQTAALIFIDEIDAIAPSRDGSDGNGAMQRLLSQLLTELDGFDQPPGRLFFLGATNRPWDLDMALLRPGRFDALAYVPLPEPDARMALLNICLVGLPLAQGFEAEPLLRLTQGCSGAEVQALVAMATEAAFLEACERAVERQLTVADFENAAHRVHRAATAELLERYTQFPHRVGQLPDAPPAPSPAMTMNNDVGRASEISSFTGL